MRSADREGTMALEPGVGVWLYLGSSDLLTELQAELPSSTHSPLGCTAVPCPLLFKLGNKFF